MPSPGFDQSWQTGLGLAREARLQFGADFTYTFGPWGWLQVPVVVNQSQIAFHTLFHLGTTATFLLTVLWVVRQRWTATWTVTLFVLIGIVCGSLLSPDEQLLASLFAASFWILNTPETGRSRPYVLIAIGAIAALMIQVKVSTGVIAAVCVLLVLLGILRSPRDPLALAASYLFAFLSLWLLADQSLGDIRQWLWLSTENISGYAGTLATYPDELLPQLVFAAFAACMVLLLLLRLSETGLSLLAKFAALLLVAFAIYASVKIGFVRQESLRAASSIVMLSPLFISLLPRHWPPAQSGLVAIAPALGVVAVMYTGPFHFLPSSMTLLPPGPRFVQSALDLPARAADWHRTVRMIDPEGVAYLASASEARSSGSSVYGFSPEFVDELRERSVQVDPWQTAVVWTYDLDWSPVPAFQPVVATTPDLDRLNANAVVQRGSNEAILTDSQPEALLGTNPMWQSPEYQLQIRCRYEIVRAEDDWQLLANSGSSRCEKPRPLRTVAVKAGYPVEIPPTGVSELLVLRYRAEIGVLERLISALYKPSGPLLVEMGDESFVLPWGFAHDSPLLVCRSKDVPPLIAGEPTCSSTREHMTFSHNGTVTWEVISYATP